jgi:hypothetical protein
MDISIVAVIIPASVFTYKATLGDADRDEQPDLGLAASRFSWQGKH